MSANEKLYCLYSRSEMRFCAYAVSVSIGMIVINLISIYGGVLS